MISPDRPIEGKADDKLGRSGFANSLAKSILSYHGESSFCIGIYGDWGSGKTSLLNMILEDIRSNDDKTIIVRFNPWLCADTQQLINQFFKQLSEEIKLKVKTSDKVWKLVEQYASIFDITSYLPGPWAATSVLGKLIGKKASSKTSQIEANMQKQKNNIIQALKDENAKIVISIDDIDRLSEKEIISVFQLVKSLADFPNTIYLLAFDYNVVINALSKVQNGEGKAYLEKIVQVPFEIPAPNIDNIYNTLFYQLNSILGKVDENKFNKTEWQLLFHYGISKYIKSIRDVIRFVNVFSLKYYMLEEEIDPVDLLGITCLQVFEPLIYSNLSTHSELLCGDIPSYTSNSTQEKIKNIEAGIDNLISENNNCINYEAALNILCLLFPKVSEIKKLFSYTITYDHRTFLLANKVAVPQCFYRYFSLSLEDKAIPSSTINSMFFNMGKTDISEAILQFEKQDKIVQFFEKIDAYSHSNYKSEIPIDRIKTLVWAIMYQWPKLSDRDESFFSLPLVWRVQQCLCDLLDLIPKTERFSFIKSLFDDDAIQPIALSHLLECFESDYGRCFEEIKEKEKKNIELAELFELEKILTERAVYFIESQDYLTKENLLQENSIGFLWLLEKINEQCAKELKQKLVIKDLSLALVIAYCASHGKAAIAVVVKTIIIHFDRLSEFISIEEAKQRMSHFVKGSEFSLLSHETKLDVLAFLLKCKKNEGTDTSYGIAVEVIEKELRSLDQSN